MLSRNKVALLLSASSLGVQAFTSTARGRSSSPLFYKDVNKDDEIYTFPNNLDLPEMTHDWKPEMPSYPQGISPFAILPDDFKETLVQNATSKSTIEELVDDIKSQAAMIEDVVENEEVVDMSITESLQEQERHELAFLQKEDINESTSTNQKTPFQYLQKLRSDLGFIQRDQTMHDISLSISNPNKVDQEPDPLEFVTTTRDRALHLVNQVYKHDTEKDNAPLSFEAYSKVKHTSASIMKERKTYHKVHPVLRKKLEQKQRIKKMYRGIHTFHMLMVLTVSKKLTERIIINYVSSVLRDCAAFDTWHNGRNEKSE
ncbi:predicted protein [Chaetoceros tenuissimus]|uniref:Uncharacterized protein n=1 Tax=Chaetoceros tenuissimus TaxID=426638 RepID=A0AAD3D415_9STRA|nr:predicted protein [Chaetoceros tenuissimus]